MEGTLSVTYREWWIERPGRLKLHVRAWEPERPQAALVVLHGLGDHAGRYERFGRGLARRGFAVHALDLPGHGQSEGRRGHIRGWSDLRDALDDVVSAVCPAGDGRPLLLFGHSMGALVALDWAFANPERAHALLLSAPPFELAMKPLVFKVWLARLAEQLFPALTQGNQIPPSMLSRDPEVIRAHRADPLVHRRISARFYLEYIRTRTRLSALAPELAVPTLVIQGGDDPVASAAAAGRWAAAAPPGRITFRLYPGLLHEVLNELEGPGILEEAADWCEQTVNGDRP